MKETYTQLLIDTGFDVLHISDSDSLDYAFNIEKSLYYIVTYYDNYDTFVQEFEEAQRDAYKHICSLEDENIIKKNTYFIVFVKSDNSSELNKAVLELQESTLFFKKSIISYSESEYVSLKNECKSRSIKEMIQQDTYKVKYFKGYKEEKKSDFYSLLLKIIIKTPHISLRGQNKSEYPQLQDEIMLALQLESDRRGKDYIALNSELDAITIEDYEDDIEKLWAEVL